jgi:hypothetical protein
MANYFVLKCLNPPGKAYYTLQAEYPASDKVWHKGALFSEASEWDNEQPPSEPIVLTTDAEPDNPEMFIYPELTWTPIPLMTRRLVTALRDAGVSNLQTYATTLSTTEGAPPPPQDRYFAVNIVGVVAAADLASSVISPTSTERLIAMDFDSLSIDPTLTRDLLMFRLAENTSAVLVHERIRDRIEASGIGTLTWVRPEQWAG